MPLVRNKGEGVSRRPAPGDIRTKGIRTRRPNNQQKGRLAAPSSSNRQRRSGGFGNHDHLHRGFDVGVQMHDDFEFAGGAESAFRSDEHTSELQSLMRTSHAVSCWNNKTNT